MTRDKEPNVMEEKQKQKTLGDNAELTEKQAEHTPVFREHLKVDHKNSIDFLLNCKSFHII